ncbi:hypothetical protein MTO96_016227 [Rhipicephalus appendiculatus]
MFSGFLMPKFHTLFKPLRRFFRDVEEHRLVVWFATEFQNETGETEFDVSGLLMLLVILHATGCFVLVLEIVVARFHTKGSIVPRELRDNLSSLFRRRGAEYI